MGSPIRKLRKRPWRRRNLKPWLHVSRDLAQVQRLGLNRGRYLGETIEIHSILNEIQTSALQHGWKRDHILPDQSLCLAGYHLPAPAPQKRLYISAGIHGDEPAGPTAVLQSVSRMSNEYTSNGGLLNLKFLPEFFDTETNVDKFAQFLRAFVDLEVPHVQFNVVRREDLIAAKANPEQYRSLTIRVAGYTAYFTELSGDLQDEIIARTTHDM